MFNNIAPLEKFNFKCPEEWITWARRFEHYRIATGLNAKDESEQVNMLIYLLGDEADDIYLSFMLSTADSAKYNVVLDKFYGDPTTVADDVQGSWNPLQRGPAQNLHQEAGDYTYAFKVQKGGDDTSPAQGSRNPCRIYTRRLEMAPMPLKLTHSINGKLVDNEEAASTRKKWTSSILLSKNKSNIGERNFALSEKLQLIPDLTMDKAIEIAKQTEAVIMQQKSLRDDCLAKTNVNFVKKQNKSNFSKVKGSNLEHDESSIPGNSKAWYQAGGAKACTRCGSPKFLKFEHCPAFNATCRRCSKMGHFMKQCKTKLVSQVTIKYYNEKFLGNFCIDQISSDERWNCKVAVNRRIMPFKIDTGADDYPELFSGLGKLNEPYKIELNDQAQPYAIHTPRRILFPLMNKTKQKLKEMDQQGVIEKVDNATDWFSPMVIEPKKNNEIRICVDLTKLNEKIKRERDQMPILEETLSQLSNGKVFSKLDANSGFWQIPLDDKSKDFTTFLTPFGRYRFCRLPFGITSAPEHFQKRMSEVLGDIEGSMCHLDDIIVWGSNQQEHDGRLKQVLSKLKETGLTLNNEKCVLSSPKFKFLGHQIGSEGLKPDENDKLSL
ncbi:hypothetical protein LAZ67_13001367 [Cordylochernes scorpioides]|uniref:Reverse transcriptase domain-containing protein n=1 Tax=Cordylochernes scorpioides TaxID=51811 RepID=A0ABY6L3S0_9ARAC|nr:hypothetical protein LAZ67_13001367 [Cordylochernes scorpioides]